MGVGVISKVRDIQRPLDLLSMALRPPVRGDGPELF